MADDSQNDEPLHLAVPLILAGAAGKSPEEREAFLEKACGGDEALKEQVKRAIEEDDLSDSDATKAMGVGMIQPGGESVAVKESTPLAFGDYEILGTIAQGGMGVVYRARQISLNRIVALKTNLNSVLATSDEISRFRIEAEAAGRAEHPNIVPIYEIGEEDGMHFFSMKLIEGGTLVDPPETLAGDRRKLVGCILKVAQALESAHRSGVIHRDIKPGNILIDESGEPHLTDFGLAKRVEEDHALTLSGQILGTPAFLSPEQAVGGPLTTASDVYSLGAVLYSLLAKKTPFGGTSILDTLRRVEVEEPTPLRQIDGTIDRDLETIVLKCLEKKPADRYGSADDFANELQRWLNGEPIAARPVSPPERFVKWARRRPSRAALAAVGTLFLLTLAVGGPLVGIRQAQLKAVADERAEVIQENLYFSDMTLATNLVGEQNDLNRIQVALDRWHPEETGRDLRGWEWWFLDALKPEELSTIHFEEAPEAISMSPDEQSMAIAYSHHVEVRSGDLLELQSRFRLPVSELDWHPDSQLLAMKGHFEDVTFYDRDTGEKRKSAIRPAPFSFSVEWSPKGRFLAFANPTTAFEIWNTETEEKVAELGKKRGPVQSAWDRRNNTLFFQNQKDFIGTWQSDHPEARSLGKVEVSNIESMQVSPDNRSLAIGSTRSEVALVSLETESLETTLDGGGAEPIKLLSWSPEGGRLAAASRDGEIDLWDVKAAVASHEFRVEGRLMHLKWMRDDRLLVGCADRAFFLDLARLEKPTIHTGMRLWLHMLSWSKNGNLFVPSGSRILRWQPGKGDPETVYTGEDKLGRIAVSPSGDRVLAQFRIGQEAYLGVVDLEQGVELWRIPLVHWLTDLSWSPDGTRIATAQNRTGVQLRDPESGDLLFHFKDEKRGDRGGNNVTGIAWAPAGDKLVTQIPDGVYTVLDMETGNRIASHDTSPLPGSWGYGIQWEPSGKRLASIPEDGGVMIWTQEGSELRLESHLQKTISGISDIAWSPDGSRIATIGTTNEIHLIDPSTGTITLRFRIPPGESTRAGQDLAWSPDGKWLAYTAAEWMEVRFLEATDWENERGALIPKEESNP